MRLFGKRPVIERLKSNPKTIQTLYFDKYHDLSGIVKMARRKEVPYKIVDPRRFANLTRNVNSQGVLAEVDAYKYSDIEDIIATSNKPNLIFLDSITDPQNFGSMLRTSACFGNFAFIIPKHRSVEVNETVLRIASGAENYIPVVKIVNLLHGINLAKDAGYTVIGASPEAENSLDSIKFQFPIALVIGSEGKGISQNIEKNLDSRLKIPMGGEGLSFNASISLAIICYEISRQINLTK
jgi:23S rRNA (guanosine2251-2'-O)-methyltransferase